MEYWEQYATVTVFSQEQKINVVITRLEQYATVTVFSQEQKINVVITRLDRVIQTICGALDTPVKPEYDA